MLTGLLTPRTARTAFRLSFYVRCSLGTDREQNRRARTVHTRRDAIPSQEVQAKRNGEIHTFPAANSNPSQLAVSHRNAIQVIDYGIDLLAFYKEADWSCTQIAPSERYFDPPETDPDHSLIIISTR